MVAGLHLHLGRIEPVMVLQILPLLLLVSLGAGLLLAACFRPRAVLILLLVWLVLEGFLRRELPGLSTPLVFVKDALLLVLYLGMLVRAMARRRLRMPVPFPLLLAGLLPFLGLSLVQSLNPSLQGILLGVLGLKVYYFYMPLSLVTWTLIKRERDLHQLLSPLAVIAIVSAAAAAYQVLFMASSYWSGGSIDFYVRTRTGADSISEIVLPTGPFTGEGRLGGYGMFLMLVFGSLTAVARERLGPRTWLYRLSFVASVAALILSARRTPMFVGVALLVVLFCLVLSTSGDWRRFQMTGWRQRRAAVVTAAVAIVTVLSIAPRHVGQVGNFVVETFFKEATINIYDYTGQRYSGFTYAAWVRPVEHFKSTVNAAGWLGKGIGSSSMGVNFLDHDALLSVRASEHGPHKVFWEIGLAGLLTFGFFYGLVCYVGYRYAARMRGHALYPLGLGLWLCIPAFLLHFWKSFSFHDDAFQQIMLWTIVGALFALPKVRDADAEPGKIAHPH